MYTHTHTHTNTHTHPSIHPSIHTQHTHTHTSTHTQGLQANAYVYTALLDACAKRFDIAAGQRVLAAAEAAAAAGAVPPSTHMYTAMLDLYARAGNADKVLCVCVYIYMETYVYICVLYV